MTKLRFRYQTLEFGDHDIHVRTLRDNQQFRDDDGLAESLGISSATWPLFGILWDSGRVLAELMSTWDIEGKRILEVGCGIGLASLVLNQRGADITASDYHPEAGAFLEFNARLNGDSPIPFVRADWASPDPSLGKFDLIIGSDLLYERDHADDLSAFINVHAADACTVLIVDPGRPHRGRFTKRMAEFGFEHTRETSDERDDTKDSYKGQLLSFVRK